MPPVLWDSARFVFGVVVCHHHHFPAGEGGLAIGAFHLELEAQALTTNVGSADANPNLIIKLMDTR